MHRIIARLIADATLVGIVMFTTARTLAWGSAWVLLAVLLHVARGLSTDSGRW